LVELCIPDAEVRNQLREADPRPMLGCIGAAQS
jgi:hypothetical protein